MKQIMIKRLCIPCGRYESYKQKHQTLNCTKDLCYALLWHFDGDEVEADEDRYFYLDQAEKVYVSLSSQNI